VIGSTTHYNRLRYRRRITDRSVPVSEHFEGDESESDAETDGEPECERAAKRARAKEADTDTQERRCEDVPGRAETDRESGEGHVQDVRPSTDTGFDASAGPFGRSLPSR